MARIELDSVSKAFGGVRAVDDISLVVPSGSFTVLVGPSGCGKTTTLRMIAGLEDVTSGVIRIGDDVMNDVPPAERDIAMVFQNYALYPHMTVVENIGFGLRMRRSPKREIAERIDWVAEMLDLEGLLARKPRQLSGGQRQRVALGRAIARRPRVFLMDEPLSNLDAKLRTQTRAELVRLHDELEATFVYVTHDQVEAMSMGTQVVVMDQGQIMQAASPSTIYHKPANKFVAQFMGSPPANLISVRIAHRADGAGVFVVDEQFPVNGHAIGRVQHLEEGTELILGLRPEHIALSGDSGPRFKVDLVEFLGHDALVHLNANGMRLIARIDSRTAPREQETVRLRVESEYVRWFDSTTGQAMDAE